MMRRKMIVFALLIALSIFVGASCLSMKQESDTGKLYHKGSVYCKEFNCTYKENVLDEKASAYGTFNDTLLVSGWGELEIASGQAPSTPMTDKEIMFAAGFLEGAFTAKQMELNFANLNDSFGFSKSVQKKFSNWFVKNRQWVDMKIKDAPKDPLWRHVSYIVSQFDGLLAGYQSVRKGVPGALDSYAISFLNGVGDILDLQYALQPSSFPDWQNFSPKEAERFFYSSGHCSALIKLLPGFENMYMSHSSWFIYASTNRIYKHYNFNVQDEATIARQLSFSSYPGFLESLDDFYLLDSGLVMLQTTNSIFNKELYKKVKPQSLLSWQRVRVANMMASGGKQWTDIIAKYNSGTYNNQYMVIDLKKFVPMKSIPDDTLWVAEQIPGLVVARDLTEILRAGYFPSYNIPFFEEIFNKSGYPEYVKQYGNGYTYDLAPRAKIFRRDESTVTDLDSMKAIMRYNDYTEDPYSGKSPWGAICSRGDLDEKQPLMDGCYDTKVADYTMALESKADAINGPTLGTNLPPFSWTGAAARAPHQGLPQTYNFDFVRMQPRLELKN